VKGSTHFGPQASWPTGHCDAQVPPEQYPPQALPASAPVHVAAAPQWSGSFWGSTHVPLQSTSPGWQDTAQPPFEQTSPGPQGEPCSPAPHVPPAPQ
jgi:hypothetical protein